MLAPAPLMLAMVATAPLTEGPLLVVPFEREPQPAASSGVAATAATPATRILRLRSNMCTPSLRRDTRPSRFKLSGCRNRQECAESDRTRQEYLKYRSRPVLRLSVVTASSRPPRHCRLHGTRRDAWPDRGHPQSRPTAFPATVRCERSSRRCRCDARYVTSSYRCSRQAPGSSHRDVPPSAGKT